MNHDNDNHTAGATIVAACALAGKEVFREIIHMNSRLVAAALVVHCLGFRECICDN